jgi:ligand-binding sensor domain-containing protein/signal transduction histidine kinase
LKSDGQNFFNLLTYPTIWVVLIFLCSNIFPQTEPTIKENIFQSSLNLHQWGTISSFNGLPSERVNAIAQTPDGFLWFATDNGLAKFDGRRVQTNLSAGLSSLRILTLQTDADGTLWIGTEKGAFYHNNNFFQLIQETSDNAINSIFVDKQTIYLANPNGMVFQATRRDETVRTNIILKSDLPIRSVAVIEDELFIGTFNGGLFKVTNGDAEQFITRPRPFFISVLAKNSDNKMWLGAATGFENSGLFLAETFPNLKPVGESLGAINSISFGDNRATWVGTDERGAYLFKDAKFSRRFTFENTSGGLRSNKILATFVDRERVIWFGTDKGISRYDPESPQNEKISDVVQSNFVRLLFLAKDGKTYAGTNRGLYRFDETEEIWQGIFGFENRSIYAIAENAGGSLLVGSASSLSAKDPTSQNRSVEQLIEDESIRTIREFQGEIYFASFGIGLKKLEPDEPRILAESTIISLYNENDKILWIGTINKGIFAFDGKNISQKPELGELKNTAVRAMSGNEADGLWFATDKGLYLFKNGELQIILANQNARDVFTQRDILSNELRVWCATENGLFNLTFNENFGWISSRIDIEQGLSSQNIFAILPHQTDSILIGTNRGVVRYAMSRTRPLLVPNRILSQRIHQTNELETGINLNYPQNSLSVEVLAISSRTFPEQFQYSFLLFNSNNEIIDKKFSEDSQFLMDNLEPDKYRVEIRAFDKNLLASEPLTFNFTVEQAPFPWIATILAVLLIIALTALIWAIISQRKIFQTSNELVLANEELSNARLSLANEAERERHRISRDLHDQTLADLRHLILMADEVPSENTNEFRMEIENVSNEIRRICEDLSPSVLENIGFAAALEWSMGNSVEQVSKEHKITYEFIADDKLEDNLNLSRSEQIQIYRIAQEVLSNIVRHSEATEIKMTATTSVEDGFILKIQDNGKAFNPEKSKKGRGLANINARAKLIEAEVGWKKARHRGMIFTLTKV